MKNHLFIGLGGQGGRSLAELRKVMEQRHRDVEQLLEKEKLKWDFLSIDSSSDVWDTRKDWKYFGKDLRLKQEQMLKLEPVAVGASIDQLALRPDVAPWIGNKSVVKDFVGGDGGKDGATKGANQRRRFGRLLFASAATSIAEDIKTRVEQLTRGRDNVCWFHLFASVAGGTGSGGLIDIISTLRTEFPNTENFRISVHLYATSQDKKNAGVGYFFQNQYAALRDLNALICGSLRPTLLGEGRGGAKFTEGQPVSSVSLATQLNSRNQGISLEDQIRITAECCFERIYAFATGQLGPDGQRSLTMEDIQAAFPGEPSRAMERSYRFSSLGMRRWEVPNEKIEELIALDLISSSLSQMLTNHWQEKVGFVSDGIPLDEGQMEAILSEMNGHLDGGLVAASQGTELKRDLEKRFVELSKGLASQGDTLEKLEDAAEHHFTNDFREGGVENLFRGVKVRRKGAVERLARDLDKVLTTAWLNRGNPVGIEHLIEIISRFDAQVRASLGADGAQGGAVSSGRLLARKGEWEKMTPLSRPIKSGALLRAHLRDLVAKFSADLDRRAAAEDKEFLLAVLDGLSELRLRYVAAKNVLGQLLNRIDEERETVDAELRQMGDGQRANKYEFDQAALDKFREVLRTDRDHQRLTSEKMRERVSEPEMQKTLGRFRGREEAERESLDDRLRKIGRESAVDAHGEICRKFDVAKVLGDSLCERLETRFAGSDGTLEDEANEFLRLAASCSLLAKDETQPATLLGGGIGIPRMPKRLIVFGVPKHPYAAKIAAALRAAIPAGENFQYESYEHDDPSQLRLMVVDYWMAARFATVTKELKAHYITLTGDSKLSVPYFCNIDTEGEENRRPDLLLPTPDELRERLEAEVWVGERMEPPVFKLGEAGFVLLTYAPVNAEVLGKGKEPFFESADLTTMFKVSSEVKARVRNLKSEERSALEKSVEDEEARIVAEEDNSGQAFQDWQRVRKQIKTVLGEQKNG